MKEVFHRGLVT